MNLRPLLLLVALATSCFADDKLVSVDAKTKVITVESSGVLKLYRVADTVQVTFNGAPSALAQLVPGQTVAIKATDTIFATKIAASGLGQTSKPALPLALRSITVQMRVDGSDRIFYQDGKLWIEHLEAKRPTDIFINGVEWTPVWNDKATEPLTSFAIPLAPIGQGRVSLKQLAGRGKVKMENSTKAAAMAVIEDGKPGADEFAFQFVW